MLPLTLTLSELESRYLLNITEGHEYNELSDTFIFVELKNYKRYLPINEAADILKAKIIPSLVTKYYNRELNIKEGTRILVTIEKRYPTSDGTYFVSNNFAKHIGFH
jgi:hypothetical protein